MKLAYKIIARLSVALLVLMAGWAAAFYFIVVDEINDETDDALEDYSYSIIMRSLAGESLPSNDNGTNNTYYLHEVDADYAERHPRVSYTDETVYIYAKQETEPARVLKTIFRDSDDRWYELTVAIPSFEKDDLQRKILIWIVILYVVLLLSVLAVNAWIIQRSFRPLYALLDWFADLKLGGELPPLANDTDVTEFRRLNDAVLQSARRNNEIYEEQRAFIGNASHELQTPIAVCQNRLELLSDDPSLTERQLEQIISTRRTLDHISRLNRTLLLLTRLDNARFDDTAEVDVNAVVRQLLDDYGEIYSGSGIVSELSEQARLRFYMDETLASVLFGNLIKNAFMHTESGGRVTVGVFADKVVVRNTADGGALNPEWIFRRFYKGGKSRGSSGLGLALVEAVAKIYGLTVSYEYSDGEHVFTVCFTPPA